MPFPRSVCFGDTAFLSVARSAVSSLSLIFASTALLPAGALRRGLARAWCFRFQRFFVWRLWGISSIGPVTSRVHCVAVSTAGALAAALAWGFAVEFFVYVWKSVGLFTVNKAVHIAACAERVSSPFVMH